jgi:thimet oligopeptidase
LPSVFTPRAAPLRFSKWHQTKPQQPGGFFIKEKAHGAMPETPYQLGNRRKIEKMEDFPTMSTETAAALENLHAWESGGSSSAEALTAWVTARLAAHEAALARLLAVQGARTPENTLRHYDAAIEQLNLAGSQAGILNSVAAGKAVRDQAQQEAQRVAMAGSALSLNRQVYEALAAIGLDGASPATRYYVERTLLSYRLAGVDKDLATRDRLQALHEKTTRLSLEFSRNIQEGAKTIEATPEELDGLPADYLARHPANAEGRIALSTDQPDMQPVMTFASSAALRERMFVAYNTRAYPVNQQILLDLLATRQEIASVLGFRSWADLATADQMMGSAANVRAFLAKLDEASREGARREHQEVLAFARKRQPGLSEIDIVSRAYWYEQFRRSAFDFDSQSVRPYFPYAQVEAGVLQTAAKLFQVEFRRSNASAWHPAVSVFDVFDGGCPAGRFYLDMHPREGKDKWFSAAPVVTGVRGGALPEAALICNFSGGDGTDPGLLQYSDVVTYFHEFGHLMHAILGGHTEWAGLSGFATEGDFIEVPSQMLEEFFRDAKLLQSFARHYETGEILPENLIRDLKRASAFGRADWMRSQLYYTTLSLDLHDREPAGLDLNAVTRHLYECFQPWTWREGNRMYASFGHLTGYSSNYYTYAFDKVIALDFFAQFDPKDLLNGATGARYRKTVLEQGGSKPGRQMVRDFLGRDEEFAALSTWLNEEFEGELPATKR